VDVCISLIAFSMLETLESTSKKLSKALKTSGSTSRQGVQKKLKLKMEQKVGVMRSALFCGWCQHQ